MPVYEYACSLCGSVTERRRDAEHRDCPVLCPCRRGIAKRAVSSVGGLVRSARTLSGDVTTRAIPNVVIEGGSFDHCGTAIAMDGGFVVANGLTITNTPVAFDLKNGARVDATNIVHRPTVEADEKKPRRFRGRGEQ